MKNHSRKVRQMAEDLLPMLQESLGDDAVITACDLPGDDVETMHIRVAFPGVQEAFTLKLRYRPKQGALEITPD